MQLHADQASHSSVPAIKTFLMKANRLGELKAIPTSLQQSEEAEPPPTEEEIRVDRELSSAANAYDRAVGTVNFGDNLVNIEPSAWRADDERQDP